MPEEEPESTPPKNAVAEGTGRQREEETQDSATLLPDETHNFPVAHTASQQSIKPEQYGAQTAAQQQQQWQAGLYYQDANGNTQGPYDMPAMRSFNQQWPLLFPPSMMLWHTDGHLHSSMVPLAWCLAGRLPQPDAPLTAKRSAVGVIDSSEAASTSYSGYAEAVLAGGSSSTALRSVPALVVYQMLMGAACLGG